MRRVKTALRKGITFLLTPIAAGLAIMILLYLEKVVDGDGDRERPLW